MKTIKNYTIPTSLQRRKTMLKKIYTAVLSLMIAQGMAAIGFAGGVGTTGAQFLKIGTGARPIGMGQAFMAVADDLNALYYNPAGLAQQYERQATASYLRYFQDVSIGFLGYSQPLGEGTFGVGLNYLYVGGIEKRRLVSDGGVGDSDVPEDKFGAYDAALSLSYADQELLGRYVEGLDVGFNVKIIRQEIDTEDANSVAIDLATLYRTGITDLNMSLGVYNIGPEVKFVEEGDPLPFGVGFGMSYRMLNRKLLIAGDVLDYVIDERFYGDIGLEYSLIEVMALRAGYRFGMDSELGGGAGLGTGLGFNVWGVCLDYAFAPFGELGDTHRISISTKF
ncbi:MAG: PorV/PorQ family protein [Elusimicrobia bacterium]|nr:PorV/PorQ family protein [Elusimicrobiota bacterium]MBD3411496.1 PorV/PorQ family protein [Elusimicrobiota bacterium]